jgi:hypothetical protein
MMERVIKFEMNFLYQLRVKVGRSGKGILRQWCRFNILVFDREGGDGTKHCQKIKWRQ